MKAKIEWIFHVQRRIGDIWSTVSVVLKDFPSSERPDLPENEEEFRRDLQLWFPGWSDVGCMRLVAWNESFPDKAR